MSDYIRKEDAIKCIELMTWYHVNGRGQLVDGATTDTGLYKAKDVYKGLHGIPAADVAPVVHGRWIDDGTEFGCQCSECGKSLDDYVAPTEYASLNEIPNFCPNCGAKMDAR